MTIVSELQPKSNCEWVFFFSSFFRMDYYSILSFYSLIIFFYPEHVLELDLSVQADICSDFFSSVASRVCRLYDCNECVLRGFEAFVEQDGVVSNTVVEISLFTADQKIQHTDLLIEQSFNVYIYIYIYIWNLF